MKILFLQKKEAPKLGPLVNFLIYPTKLFKALPGLNFGTFFAGICIFLPVAGLTPTRLLRLMTTNVPNPVNATSLFCFNALLTEVINA